MIKQALYLRKPNKLHKLLGIYYANKALRKFNRFKASYEKKWAVLELTK